MNETALQQLAREMPLTEGKAGEELAEAITESWDATEERVRMLLFNRLAMHAAEGREKDGK